MQRHHSAVVIAFLSAIAGMPVSAQVTGQHGRAVGGSSSSDSAFAAMQMRGKTAMGVDQYTSTHVFDVLPDGGRIELQRVADDSAGVAQIRRHLQEIAKAFKDGDFRTPAFVHMQQVPGTVVMAAKRAAVTYTYRELPRGGEVWIATKDPEALGAIREFIAFQQTDHRVGETDKAKAHGVMDHSGATHAGVKKP